MCYSREAASNIYTSLPNWVNHVSSPAPSLHCRLLIQPGVLLILSPPPPPPHPVPTLRRVSTQKILRRSRSMDRPLGQSSCVSTIVWRWLPSRPARSILGTAPQSDQYIHLSTGHGSRSRSRSRSRVTVTGHGSRVMVTVSMAGTYMTASEHRDTDGCRGLGERWTMPLVWGHERAKEVRGCDCLNRIVDSNKQCVTMCERVKHIALAGEHCILTIRPETNKEMQQRNPNPF